MSVYIAGDNILWTNERKSGLVNFQREGERDREDVKRLRYIGVFFFVDGRSQRFEKGRRKGIVPISLVPTDRQ